jgi:hypothetical protein
MLDQRLDQQTGKRELTTDLPVCCLASDLRYVGNSLVSVCWLASDLRYVGNSLVPGCWLASDLSNKGS